MKESLSGYPDVCSQQLRRAILQAAHVTLEVGPGIHPLFYEQGDQDNFGDKNVYVGWNIDPQQHRVLTEYFMGIFEDESQDTFGLYALHVPHSSELRGDMLSHLPASSVDVVIAGNVMGESQSNDHYAELDEVRHKKAGYIGSTSRLQTQQTIDIIWDLLKTDGLLICYETMTPEHALHFVDYGCIPAVLAYFRASGKSFNLLQHCYPRQSPNHFFRLMAEYAPRRAGHSDMSPNSFICVLQKKRDEV